LNFGFYGDICGGGDGRILISYLLFYWFFKLITRGSAFYLIDRIFQDELSVLAIAQVGFSVGRGSDNPG
jgi:hypothetical protein